MTRKEWMKEFGKYIGGLNDDERDRAMSFYAELYNDKYDIGMRESDIVRSFGDPYTAACEVMRDAGKDPDEYLVVRHREGNRVKKSPNYVEHYDVCEERVGRGDAERKPLKRRKRSVLAEILCIFLCLAGGIGIFYAVTAIINAATKAGHVWEPTLDAFAEFEIELSAADVEVKNGDSWKIEYETTAFCNFDITEASESDKNVLILRQNCLPMLSMGGVKVTVYVPSVDELSVDMSAGNMSIDSIDLNVMKIDHSAGDIDIKNGRVGSLDVENSAGGISLENMEVDTLSVDLSAGGVTLENVSAHTSTFDVSAGGVSFDRFEVVSSINISLSAGSISGTLVGREEDYSVSVSLSAGSTNLTNAVRDTGKSITAGMSAGSIEITFVD